ncbi:hypothetical protein L4D76_07005 [Photobacterium sagamiensis]|uniref:hypothetical protein n=1 Tax=Photobacterium sagamiensis TaxID=2910241 RepID=UPI003D132C90
MKFISCTILSRSMVQDFDSVDSAIGFIDRNVDKGFFSAYIRVLESQEEFTFWFSNQESMLDNLMNL